MVVATIKGFEICRKDTVLKALYSIRMKTLIQNFKYIRVPVGTPIPSHSSTPTRILPLGRLRTQAEFPSRNSGVGHAQGEVEGGLGLMENRALGVKSLD